MTTLLFFYGTLKRGCSNHAHLAGQAFVDVARTIPGFRLYDMGGYPNMVPCPDDRDGVLGEVWSIDEKALQRLDEFEGVHTGLYRRAPIGLQAPFSNQRVEVYVSDLPVTGRQEIGNEWREM